MANDILNKVIKQLKPKNVTLVAVSKTKPNEAILEMYNEGNVFLVKTEFKNWLPNMKFYPKILNGI